VLLGAVRGPIGSFLFMNLRLLTDQSLENTTGAGALPWTWPHNEQVIDFTRPFMPSSPAPSPISSSPLG
jgi:hypothetical protein